MLVSVTPYAHGAASSYHSNIAYCSDEKLKLIKHLWVSIGGFLGTLYSSIFLFNDAAAVLIGFAIAFFCVAIIFGRSICKLKENESESVRATKDIDLIVLFSWYNCTGFLSISSILTWLCFSKISIFFLVGFWGFWSAVSLFRLIVRYYDEEIARIDRRIDLSRRLLKEQLDD